MRRRIKVDVKTLVAVSIAVLLLAVYWLAVDLAQRYYGFREEMSSTYSQSEIGLKVLYRYMDELGYDVRTLSLFDEMPEEGTIVVAASTSLDRHFTEDEVTRLRDWVDSGGRLVLVGWQAREAIGLSPRDVAPATGSEATVTPSFPSASVSGVEDIAVGTGRLLTSDPAWVSVVEEYSGQVLVERAFGEGGVLWLSDVTPLANSGIERADNALFAVTMLTRGSGPIYFDEYHHGFAEGGGIWARLLAGGQAAVIVGAFALFFLILARARRIGPPILEPETPPARTSAYIDSLAELYRKAGARGESLQALEEGLTRSLARRYGTVALGLARRTEAAAILEHSAALRQRGDMSESEFVSVAGRIVRLRREVEGIDG